MAFAHAADYAPGVSRERTRRRARDRVELLADSGLDADAMRLEAIEILTTAVGFDRWCSLLLDPDTLAISQGIGRNDWFDQFPRLNLSEARDGDVNTHAMLARSRDHVGILSAATGGDLARSERWRECLGPHGVGDELGCVAADELGCWGDFRFYRSSDDPSFSPDDALLMRQLSRALARGLRRGAVAPIEGTDSAPAGMGVLLLDEQLRPSGTTGAARAWFAALDPTGTAPDSIPGVAWNLAGRLIAIEHGRDTGRAARARTRTCSGHWALVEAARIDGGSSGIAITVRAAGIEDVLGLVTRASGLTPRERELVALLLEGLATRELCERLFISRHTVQDHLKSVFHKVGVRSRRELVSRVFAQTG
jgi:DNA-binding CsgD family transcriptional regulator